MRAVIEMIKKLLRGAYLEMKKLLCRMLPG